MRYVLKNQEMQTVDHETIHGIGIPGLVLMERASKAVADKAAQIADHSQRILIISGIGNNGGDALACTRILLEQDYLVDYVIVGNIEKASADLKLQLQILKNLGYFPIDCEDVNFHEYDLLIEGIFGVGLSREVGGVYKEVIERINACGKPVIAIDIPSGISGDSGKILGCAVHASSTVTFGGYKRGHLLYPGREYCGDIKLVSIGFHNQTIKKYATGYILEESDHLMPERKAYSNKGSYGKVLMITGSPGMAGAAFLSACAAYTVGAGLVQIYTASENRLALQELLPEAIISCYDSYDDSQLSHLLDWADVVCIGCGLGMGQISEKILKNVLKNVSCPCVIDADGLNLLSRNIELLNQCCAPVILTPHMKEMSRLTGWSIDTIMEDRFQALDQIIKQSGPDTKSSIICVLKDSRTVVAQTNRQRFVNLAGNNSMAKGGSGDVLAGTIAGLLAQHMAPFEATTVGVFLHACGGDEAKKSKGSYSVLARDLIQGMADAMKNAKECR